jgi:Nucleotidyltransferase of unknown function (DUF6036)
MLKKDDILRALREVAARLPADSSHSLAIMGGAALVLLYGVRDATKDVDAIFLTGGSTETLREAVAHVASVLDLPTDWLNDAAKGYVHGIALGQIVFEAPNLTVRSLAVQQLLAMKLSAWRDDVDIDDARLLLTKLSGGRADVWSQVRPYLVPGRELKTEYAFSDLWEAAHGHS